ncbi:HEAT repeat domain-containing protein [Halorubrum sp. AS12]|uniref:HEAT repeat domain-containing protein n=1 Tax=Halorubrum sp. AS12 TaxID=3409687 RepID=UPI003DA748B8
MPTDSEPPLSDVDPDSVAPGDVDESAVRAALASSSPMVRQRGLELCEALAEADADAVGLPLDAVASLPDDDNATVGLRAISVLDAVAEDTPGALDGRLDGVAAAAGSNIVDVQLTAATLLGKLVVERPALVAPHVGALVAGLRATEPSEDTEEYAEFVDHPATRQTLVEHDREERERRVSARRTLANVAVAVTETAPEKALDAVDDSGALVADLGALTDDADAGVAGAAVDALGHLAATDSDAVDLVADRLLGALYHDRSFVRARAVQALGRLGDPDAAPRLSAVAEEDADEDVREIAAETAAFLEAA